MSRTHWQIYSDCLIIEQCAAHCANRANMFGGCDWQTARKALALSANNSTVSQLQENLPSEGVAGVAWRTHYEDDLRCRSDAMLIASVTSEKALYK